MPVWHASVANHEHPRLWTRNTRRQAAARAKMALRGRGDRRFEWKEVGERALHLRRRVSTHESNVVGAARDIRGTAEERARLEVVAREVGPVVWERLRAIG